TKAGYVSRHYSLVFWMQSCGGGECDNMRGHSSFSCRGFWGVRSTTQPRGSTLSICMLGIRVAPPPAPRGCSNTPSVGHTPPRFDGIGDSNVQKCTPLGAFRSIIPLRCKENYNGSFLARE